MRVRLRTRQTLRETAIWLLVLTAGYAGFSFFEEIYETGSRLAARAGWSLPAPQAEAPPPTAAPIRAAIPVPGELRGTITQTVEPLPVERKRQIVLDANPYGHFHVHAQIGGKPVEFMTDTGATYVALSYETALTLGFRPSALRFDGRSTTANGVARVASITLDAIRVGDILVRDVQAVVAEPGRMAQNLLGMSFIGRLSGFELAGTKLTMTE